MSRVVREFSGVFYHELSQSTHDSHPVNFLIW